MATSDFQTLWQALTFRALRYGAAKRHRRQAGRARAVARSAQVLEDRTLLSSISGIKYLDVDGNGERNSSDPQDAQFEPPLAGFTVFLDQNENGLLDDGEPSTVTDSDGAFTFENLDAGRYLVRELVPDGFVQTEPVIQSGRLFGVDDTTSEIVELDPLDGTELNRFDPPSALTAISASSGLAYDGSSLFLITFDLTIGSDGLPATRLFELDPDDGTVLDVDTVPFSFYDGLAAADGTVYVLQSGSDVLVFDATSDTVTATLDVDVLNPGTQLLGGLGFVNGRIVAGTATSEVVFVDPDTGAVDSSFTHSGLQDFGIAGLGSEVFVGYTSAPAPATGALVEVYAVDGTLQRSFTTDFRHFALAGGGASDGGILVELDPDEDVTDLLIGNQLLNELPTAEAGGPYSVTEGGSVQLDATGSSDPDGVLQFFWDLDGDGLFGETGADAENGDEVGAMPTFDAELLDGPITRTVALRVVDEAGAIDEDTATINVTNVDPIVVLDSVTTIDENGLATLTGTIADPADETFTLDVTWGDALSPDNAQTFALGTTALSAAVDGIDWNPLTRAFSITHRYLDDNPTSTAQDVYTINVTVTDDDGGNGADAETVTVRNVAPGELALSLTDTADEGGQVSLFAVFVDPGSLDTFDVVVDWGDGGPTDTFVLGVGERSFSVTHDYLDSGTFTVTVTVTDDDGGTITETDQTVIANLPPVIETLALSTDSITEGTGQIVTLSGTFSDAALGVPTETFTGTALWSDGVAVTADQITIDTVEIEGTLFGTFTFTREFLDDHPATGTPSDQFTVDVTISDDDGGFDTETSTTLTVNNVAPVVALEQLGTIQEHGTALLTGTIADPGPLDTFTLELDWGDPLSPNNTQTFALGTTALTVADDGIDWNPTTREFSLPHQYLDDNPSVTTVDEYTVTATVTDDDTGTDTETATVDVLNVAPTLTLQAVVGIDENGVATLNGSVTDPGTLDAFTLAIDWGDGTNQVVNLAANERAFAIDHQYLDDDPSQTANDVFTIRATVLDDDSGFDTTSTTVTVGNVDPVIESLSLDDGGGGIDEGEAVTLSVVFSDVGTVDTHVVTIDWGDGTTEDIARGPGEGTFDVVHVYADDHPATGTAQDSFTINVTVTDDDGGSDSEDAAALTVRNVAPTIGIESFQFDESEVSEGQSVTVTGTFTDPALGSATESFTGAATWSDGVASAVIVDSTNGTFSTTRVFADDNPTATASDQLTVEVTITDDDTGADTETSPAVTVNNVAPSSLELGLSATSIDENGIVTLTGTFVDPGTPDVHTITVEWGDGASDTFDLAPGARSFSIDHRYLDDDPFPLFRIDVTVTDDDTGTVSEALEVLVDNVAPSGLDLVAGPDLVEGQGTVTLDGLFVDPGTLDTFTLEIDWSDGESDTFALGTDPLTLAADGIDWNPTTRVFSVDHAYQEFYQTGSIEVSITDDDAGSTSTSIAVPTGLGSLDLTADFDSTFAPPSYDLDDDGRIDFGDMSVLVGAIGGDGVLTNGRSADLDGNGRVDFADVAALVAWYGEIAPDEPNLAPLTEADLDPVVDAAIDRWGELDPAAAVVLSEVRIVIADLDDGVLGRSIGNTIVIDVDAAGLGWYVDVTPSVDEEFAGSDEKRATTSEAAGGVDLLTVLLHEMGHALGLGENEGTVMTDSLSVGIRRLPTEDLLDLDSYFANGFDPVGV